MKTKYYTALTAAVVTITTLLPSALYAAKPADTGKPATPPSTPSAPTTIPGEPSAAFFTASPTVVRTGTHPTLNWSILYPGSIGGNNGPALVDPPGTLVVNQNNTYVSVQPIGTGVTSCDSSQASTALPVDARLSVNRGPYQQLFYGTGKDVDSKYSLYIKKLKKNDTLDFGGSYQKNGSLSPFYTTLSSNMQVIALVNGATPPTSFPLYQSSTLAGYLKPYLDGFGKIKIGANSALIMMELGQTNHKLECFDYQDMILLVTLSTGHPNNGHGNNLDGVDSSNPGNGHGGPNGMVDPSGGVDDESKP